MARLWPSLALVCVVAGCGHESIEGRWEGKFPIQGGRQCAIRMMKGSRFDLVCSGGSPVAGGGSYETSDADLTLRFEWLGTESGLLNVPAPIRFRYHQQGNKISLQTSDGSSFEWRRGI